MNERDFHAPGCQEAGYSNYCRQNRLKETGLNSVEHDWEKALSAIRGCPADSTRYPAQRQVRRKCQVCLQTNDESDNYKNDIVLRKGLFLLEEKESEIDKSRNESCA